MRNVISIPMRRMDGDIRMRATVAFTETHRVGYHLGETASGGVNWVLYIIGGECP